MDIRTKLFYFDVQVNRQLIHIYNLFCLDGLQNFRNYLWNANLIRSDELGHLKGVNIICYIDAYAQQMGVILLCNRELHTAIRSLDYNSTLLQRCSCSKWTRDVVFCLTNSLRLHPCKSGRFTCAGILFIVYTYILERDRRYFWIKLKIWKIVFKKINIFLGHLH